MRWIPFAILVYLALVVQTAVAPFLSLHGVQPDFVVILAVYYALVAKPPDAMLACWIIGLASDLAGLSFAGHGNVGVRALSLGLISVLIVKVRELTFRDSVWSQLVFTFATKACLSILVGLHALYVAGAALGLNEILARSFYEAVYAAVLAPYGHWMLRQLRGPLGVGPAHRWGVR